MGSSGPSEDYGRTPPQDLAAEQSVLGGMLLSQGRDRRRRRGPARPRLLPAGPRAVFEAMLDLYGRGEPADAVTVAAELQQARRARPGRRRAAYLHTLISSVPTAANAGYYARIVRETAMLRRLVEAGTKIVQLGYARRRRRRRHRQRGPGRGLRGHRAADLARTTCRSSRSSRAPSTRSRRSAQRGGEMVGVPTGFADLDGLTNGLHPGQMIVLRAAQPARSGHAAARHAGARRQAHPADLPARIGAPAPRPARRPPRHRRHGRPAGSVQVAVTNARLADDVHELVTSLGYRCGMSVKAVRGRTPTRRAYTLTFCTDDDVFGLERKRLLHKERRAAASTATAGSSRTCGGSERAGALRRGRQRRPPLPRRRVDDPDPQLDARPGHRAVGVHQARHDVGASSAWR